MLARSVPSKSLLADAEAREDLPQQVVCGVFAGDAGKGLLRESQFFGKQLPMPHLRLRQRQVRLRRPQRAQVPLAREEYRLAVRLPARGLEYRATQRIHARAGLRRYRDGRVSARRRLESRHQVDLDRKST